MFDKLIDWLMDKRAMKPGQVRRYKGKTYIALTGTCVECAFANTGCCKLSHKVVLGCCMKDGIVFKELSHEKSKEK